MSVSNSEAKSLIENLRGAVRGTEQAGTRDWKQAEQDMKDAVTELWYALTGTDITEEMLKDLIS